MNFPRILLVGAILGVALLATLTTAQVPRTKIYSRPAPPSDEALRRLNLTTAWRAAVPMDGRRDGLLRVAMNGRDIIVLTRSGQVSRIDAETGVEKWRARVGKPYTILPFYAANSRSVYVIANAIAYSLDRKTGAKKWELSLRSGLSAGPIVDEVQAYVPAANSRLYAYSLPFVGVGDELRFGPDASAPGSNYQERIRETRPRAVWEEMTNLQLEFKPLQTSVLVFVISPSGRGIAYLKKPVDAGSTELYRFSTEGKIGQELGQFAETAYIGSEDATLYAINLNTGKLRWRHAAGSGISRRPIALEKDVYVTSAREGLARIDRDSGDAVWRIPRGRGFVPANPEADRFLAANTRYVYASDNSGRLVVLDRKRGVKLSTLPTTEFRFPVVNDLTDRLYLASNDGLIVCLHDRDQIRPIRHRYVLEQAGLPILKELDKQVVEVGDKPRTLGDTLKLIGNKYLGGMKRFKIEISVRFKDLGRADVQEAMVKIPRIEMGKGTFKDLLQAILSQVNATYQVVEDTILVIPGKPR